MNKQGIHHLNQEKCSCFTIREAMLPKSKRGECKKYKKSTQHLEKEM